MNLQAGLRRLGTENPTDTWNLKLATWRRAFQLTVLVGWGAWNLIRDPQDQILQAPTYSLALVVLKPYSDPPVCLAKPSCSFQLSLLPGLVRPHPLPIALLQEVRAHPPAPSPLVASEHEHPSQYSLSGPAQPKVGEHLEVCKLSQCPDDAPIWEPLAWRIVEGNGTPLQYSCLENPMDRGAWWAAVHGVAKSQTRLSDFTFTFHFHALEKEMATHSSVLAWKIPGTGEPAGLPSMGSHRVGHGWSNLAEAAGAAWRIKYRFLLIGLCRYLHQCFSDCGFRTTASASPGNF